MHYTGISSAPIEREPYKILVVGGSYAGLSAALNLLDLCHGKPTRFSAASSPDLKTSNEKIAVQITLVDERDGYYHLIGSPLVFASRDYALSAWTNFQDIPALQASEMTVVRGRVTAIDCETKVAKILRTETNTQAEERYDYLIAASGLSRSWPSVPQSLTREEYLLEVKKHIKQIENSQHQIVIIGGGAVGIEMAAELKLMQPSKDILLVHSRSKLLSSEPLPDSYRDHVLSLLHQSGVETLLGSRVQETITPDGGCASSTVLRLEDGKLIKAGYVINAISRYTPTSSYLPATSLDDEGYVKINSTLNFPPEISNAEYHFAAGDITLWPGIKRAGAAMHHGHYVASNIYQRMRSELFGIVPEYLEIDKYPPMICIAVGENAASWSEAAGTLSGPDVLDLYFNDDLGFKICWNYMRLGESPQLG